MATQFLTIEGIKLVIKDIAKEYGIKRVYLFGTYAKKTATLESDIDLLIEKGRPMSLLDLSGMKIKVEEQLKVSVDLITTEGTQNEFREQIQDTEVLIYEG